MSDVAARLARAEAVLHQHGCTGARVSAAGIDGEIAAVALPEIRFNALLGEQRESLAEQIRALGFRYVAVDLDPRA